MNLKLFTAALLATGATAAWTAEDFDALSEALSNQLLESYQKELDVERRSNFGKAPMAGEGWMQSIEDGLVPWMQG